MLLPRAAGAPPRALRLGASPAPLSSSGRRLGRLRSSPPPASGPRARRPARPPAAEPGAGPPRPRGCALRRGARRGFAERLGSLAQVFESIQRNAAGGGQQPQTAGIPTACPGCFKRRQTWKSQVVPCQLLPARPRTSDLRKLRAAWGGGGVHPEGRGWSPATGPRDRRPRRGGGRSNSNTTIDDNS